MALGRDLYDLDQFAGRHIDEPVVRRLWVLKVWGDVVDDGRGSRPDGMAGGGLGGSVPRDGRQGACP